MALGLQTQRWLNTSHDVGHATTTKDSAHLDRHSICFNATRLLNRKIVQQLGVGRGAGKREAAEREGSNFAVVLPTTPLGPTTRLTVGAPQCASLQRRRSSFGDPRRANGWQNPHAVTVDNRVQADVPNPCSHTRSHTQHTHQQCLPGAACLREVHQHQAAKRTRGEGSGGVGVDEVVRELL